jgi:predicted kinase
MTTVFLVCGSIGAGKTTYSIALAERRRAVRLSIDPWMQTLFGPDQTEVKFDWIMERIARCETQMWDIAAQVLRLGGDVVLDLGFTTREHRERALAHGAEVSVHFLDVPAAVRRTRVERRNQERDPAVFAFEITGFMFDFVESRFEPPNEHELAGGARIASSDGEA